MASTIIGSLFHWTFAICMFDKFENKMTPIAIASGLQFFVRSVVSFTCANCDPDVSKAIISFRDPASWKDLGEMAKYGINTVMLRVMSWWAFDVYTQLTNALPVEYLGGQTVLRNIGLFTFMIPAGISSSANVLIGN